MSEGRVQIFDVSNIETLPWPNNEDGQRTRKLLEPLIKHGLRHYIDNVEAEMSALLIDDLVLPIMVNNNNYHNSYVCSPYGHYITYTLESIENIAKPWMIPPLKMLLWTMGKILLAGEINNVVIVGNWFFSTNLHPTLTDDQVAAIRNFLQIRYPNHSLLIRSIHTYQENKTFKILKKVGFDLIGSREVFFLDTKHEAIFNSRIFKSDMKLLRETNYEVIRGIDIPHEAMNRLSSLYNSLYVGKHSKMNPQFNINFFKLAHDNNYFKLIALRKENTFDAVAGYFCQDGMMTSPLLGYDLTHTRDDKLYRLTSTVLTMEARKMGMVFHLSSGASFFKKIRKAEGNIEYNAVYHRHLPIRKRLPWWILKGVINLIGIPFMKLYNK